MDVTLDRLIELFTEIDKKRDQVYRLAIKQRNPIKVRRLWAKHERLVGYRACVGDLIQFGTPVLPD